MEKLLFAIFHLHKNETNAVNAGIQIRSFIRVTERCRVIKINSYCDISDTPLYVQAQNCAKKLFVYSYLGVRTLHGPKRIVSNFFKLYSNLKLSK